MAINLQKGQTIDLRKNDKGESVYDLSSVTMGLGWDVAKPKGLFAAFSGGNNTIDLDASCLMFGVG